MSLPALVEPASELSVNEVKRYSRHLIIPDVGMTGQKRLKNAKVLCVGAGGLGSPALLYLAAAGVGTLGGIALHALGAAHPGAGNDLVLPHRRALVVDLVPHHHPQQPLALGGRSEHAPVSRRRLLHPAQIDHVVHVTQRVDILVAHRDGKLELFRRGTHHVCSTPTLNFSTSGFERAAGKRDALVELVLLAGHHGDVIERVGIARALYHEPDLIVFDEATSALDNATEADLATAIEALHGQKTLLVVAHRLSTVRNCDRLVFISGGRIQAVGSYDELLRDIPDFRRIATAGEKPPNSS